MKIVIATRFFYPEITPRAFRAYELAKELSRTGHEVTVITTSRDYKYDKLTQETGVKVKPIVPPEPKFLMGRGIISRALRFILDYLFLYPSCFLSKGFKDVLANAPKCDLLISVAYPYPVHFGVALARIHNPSLCSVWVADCGDPFTGNKEVRLPMPFYFQILEKWFLRKVDFVTVPIEEAVQAFPEEFKYKLRVIPQGFDFTEYSEVKNDPKNKVVTFAYAGNLTPGIRDPRPMLDVLEKSGISFKFIIYTKNISFLQPYLTKLNGMLEMRNYLPRKDLLTELSNMDFLVNFENMGDRQRPSKLIDYALVRRPILSIPHGAPNKSVILEFLNRDYSNSLRVEDLSKFDIRNVVKSFVDVSKVTINLKNNR